MLLLSTIVYSLLASKIQSETRCESLKSNEYVKNLRFFCQFQSLMICGHVLNFKKKKSGSKRFFWYSNLKFCHVIFLLSFFNIFTFLIFGYTDVNWLKRIIQNIISEVKFHAESDPIVRKIHKRTTLKIIGFVIAVKLHQTLESCRFWCLDWKLSWTLKVPLFWATRLREFLEFFYLKIINGSKKYHRIKKSDN